MAQKKSDLTVQKNLLNYIIYGLAGVVSTVSSLAYIDMRTQRNNCQDQNNYFARQSFDNVIQKQVNKEQEKIIEIQSEAIQEAKSYINDSIKAVNIKNYNGKLKLKQE